MSSLEQGAISSNSQHAEALESEDLGTPRVTNNYVTGNQATIIEDITATNVNIHTNSTSVAKIIRNAATTEQCSNNPFDNIVTSTRKRINHYDESKHVSTHAERTSYRTLLERKCIFIKGKSGSGKSRLGLNILGRIAKETKRTPVELSSWQHWELIPQTRRSRAANRDESMEVASKERLEEESQYVVMIDDIFGSSNMVKSYVNDWVKMFDKIWPNVEQGDVLLILTSRPEISSLCEWKVKKYQLMKNMYYINLDEGKFSLTSFEKWKMLQRICENCFSPYEMTSIIQMDTALGFPQSCHFFSVNQHAKKMHVAFFRNPHLFVLEEVNKLRECDGIAYLVLLLVLMKGGCLRAEHLSYGSTEEFKCFVENLRQCCRLSETPTLGYIRDKADSLCGVLLTETDDGYEFQHQSVFDAIFLSISKKDPCICINKCPARVLVEFVRISPVAENEVAVSLQKKHHRLLMQRISEFLLSEEYETILDHPCLHYTEFVQTMVKRWTVECRLNEIVMRKHASHTIYGGNRDCLSSQHSLPSVFVLFSYETLLADIIMKNLSALAMTVLHKISKTDSKEIVRSCTDLLPCAIYIADNTLIHTLLDLGLEPNKDCFRVLCWSVHIERTLTDRIFASVEEVLKGMKDLESPFHLAVIRGNVHLVNLFIVKLGDRDTEHWKKVCSESLERMLENLTSYNNKFTVLSGNTIQEMMKLLMTTGCGFNRDRLVWLAASFPHATVLGLLLQDDLVSLNQMYEHSYEVDHSGDSGARTTYPPHQTNALHQAIAYGNIDCVAELIQYSRRKMISINTLVNETTQSKYGTFSPLHLAAMYGKADITCLLISLGADVNMQATSNKTPLHFAVLYDHLKVVKLLIQNQASMSVKDYEGNTPVSFVYGDPNSSTNIHLERKETVQYLACSGCDLHAVDRIGHSLLHRAATFSDHETTVFLCDSGVDVSQRNIYGSTVLHMATMWSDINMVKLLCAKGAAIETLDGHERSVLHIAAESLCDAVEKLRYFVDDMKLDVNMKDSHGNYVLSYAVRSNNAEVVDFLMDSGVKVDLTEDERRKLLLYVQPGSIEEIY